MPAVFIFHGLGGHSGENWFPWLKEKLEADGHQVIVPAFPHPDQPDLDEWMKHMVQYESLINENTIFVGHSLGGAFALRLLEHRQQSIKAVFLVATVSGPIPHRIDPLLTTFTHHPFDWNTIREKAGKFMVLHSDNDPYIPLVQAEHMAQSLGTTVTLIKGGEHLNEGAGYGTFEVLFQLVKDAS